MAPPTKQDLLKKSPEEVAAMLADLKAKRSVAESTNPAIASTMTGLDKAKLMALPPDQLAAVKERLAGAKPEERASIFEQLEGAIRSVAQKPTAAIMSGAPIDAEHPANPITEPVIAGVKTAAGMLFGERDPEFQGDVSLKGLGDEIKARYKNELASGKELIKKYPAEDVVDTAKRSAMETASFGLSEPVISGSRSLVASAKEGDLSLENLGKNFAEDRSKRERLQERMSAIDIPAQMAGAFLGPQGATRAVGKKVLERFAPNLLGKSSEAITNYFTKNPGVWKSAQKWMFESAEGGAKAGLDIAEQELARNFTLANTGFIKDEEQLNPVIAGTTGLKYGAGISAVPGAMRVAGWLGKKGAATLLGVPVAQSERYFKEIDRLRGKEASLHEVSNAIEQAAVKIQDDLTNKAASAKQAKEAFAALEAKVGEGVYGEQRKIQKRLAEAKESLNNKIADDDFELTEFQKRLGNKHHRFVAASVDDLAAQANEAKEAARAVLDNSPQTVKLGDVGKYINNFENQILKVGKGKKAAVFGDTAREAQRRVVEYRARIKNLSEAYGKKGVPAKELRKLIDQLDDDLSNPGFKQAGFIANAGDAGLYGLRRLLDDKLDIVPGWAEAIGETATRAQRLERAQAFFKDPDSIAATLRNIGDESNLDAAEVLTMIGEHTGKDFSRLVQESRDAINQVRNPAARRLRAESLPQSQEIQRIEGELAPYENKYTRDAMVESRAKAVDPTTGRNLHQEMLDSAEAVKQSEQVAGIFNNWNGMNIDTKIKSIMRGKEALRSQVKLLGDLSDQDFVRAIDDLQTLLTFDKKFVNGSSNVNFWGAVGALASGTSGNWKERILYGIIGGKAIDAYGPRMARQVLDSIATAQGVLTADKIRQWPLPKHVTDDLANQFARSLYAGVESPNPNLQMSPSEAAMFRAEVSKMDMPISKKARITNQLNRTGQAPADTLLGGQPVPEDRSPINEDIQYEEVPSVGPRNKPLIPSNQMDVLRSIIQQRRQ